jgi:outer membrane protein OmpA-like peptidoglycan-associated protein
MIILEAWVRRLAVGALLSSSLAMPAGAQEDANKSSNDSATTENCSDKPEVLRFQSGSATLNPEARRTLDQVAEELRGDDKQVARVEGYTDPVGNPDVNETLSARRAQAVESYLKRKGVDTERVETHGRGEAAEAPAEPNPDQRIAKVTTCERKLEVAQPAEEQQPAQAPPVEETPPPPPPPATATPAPAPMAPAPDVEVPPPAPEAEGISRSAAEGARAPLLGAGLGITAGGGVVGFQDSGSRSIANTGGSWEARLTLGTRTPVGLDLAYVGSAQDLNFVGLDTRAYLLGNGAEADLRLQWPRGVVRPFIFGGIGWTHYSVERGTVAGTRLRSSDDVGTVPLGVGLAIGLPHGVMFELRGTERLTFDDDIFSNSGVSSTGLDNWNATARLGAEF